jgi:hypothetical protein
MTTTGYRWFRRLLRLRPPQPRRQRHHLIPDYFIYSDNCGLHRYLFLFATLRLATVLEASSASPSKLEAPTMVHGSWWSLSPHARYWQHRYMHPSPTRSESDKLGLATSLHWLWQRLLWHRLLHLRLPSTVSPTSSLVCSVLANPEYAFVSDVRVVLAKPLCQTYLFYNRARHFLVEWANVNGHDMDNWMAGRRDDVDSFHVEIDYH